MDDGPDLAASAQIIATLFIALAVEAKVLRSRTSAWAEQKALREWMIVFLGLSAVVLIVDVAAVVGLRFFPITNAGLTLPILNLVAITYVSFLLLVTLVRDPAERSSADAGDETSDSP